MRQQGSTLIEVIVVISIIAIMAVAAGVNLITFQKKAALESTAREFVSTLKKAQTQSITGLSFAGMSPDSFDPDYLPIFGVNTESNQYNLYTQYRLSGAPSDTINTLETMKIPTGINITAPKNVYFKRNTGEAQGDNTFLITQTGNPQTLKIQISGNQFTVTTI